MPASGRRPPPGSDDDDDDDEDDEKEGENWFAGGERSGINVQNPDARAGRTPGGGLVRNLLRRAAEGGMAPDPNAEPAHSSAFTGGGHTLGSDDVQSSYIPDPNAASQEQQMETAVRYLTFWRDGFTVGEDGDLMRYDNPENQRLLQELESGTAPPSILNIQPGQHVELRVAKNTEQNFDPSLRPKKASTFGGSGNRLGAPVPSGGAPSSSGSTMPGGFGAEGSTSTRSDRPRESITTQFEVDQSLPMTSVQVRLADGTRMVCRMNHTHTVRDIRNFINASRPENLTRPYVIATTFPTKDLDDDAQTIKDAGLINSVVVQKLV